MNKEQAKAIAKKAALEVYRATMKKLAQMEAELEFGGSREWQPTEAPPAEFGDIRSITDEEKLDMTRKPENYQGTLFRQVTPEGAPRPRAEADEEYKKWFESMQDPFSDTALADDKKDKEEDDEEDNKDEKKGKKDKKDKKDKDEDKEDDKKKEASALLSVASEYQSFLKKKVIKKASPDSFKQAFYNYERVDDALLAMLEGLTAWVKEGAEADDEFAKLAPVYIGAVRRALDQALPEISDIDDRLNPES